jgi:hypothetical protein
MRRGPSFSGLTQANGMCCANSGTGVPPWKRAFFQEASFSGGDIERDDSGHSGASESQVRYVCLLPSSYIAVSPMCIWPLPDIQSLSERVAI